MNTIVLLIMSAITTCFLGCAESVRNYGPPEEFLSEPCDRIENDPVVAIQRGSEVSVRSAGKEWLHANFLTSEIAWKVDRHAFRFSDSDCVVGYASNGSVSWGSVNCNDAPIRRFRVCTVRHPSLPVSTVAAYSVSIDNVTYTGVTDTLSWCGISDEIYILVESSHAKIEVVGESTTLRYRSGEFSGICRNSVAATGDGFVFTSIDCPSAIHANVVIQCVTL